VRRQPGTVVDESEIYDYDEQHPIPDPSVIDIHGMRKGGGSDLVIVVASPLEANERSLRRLLRKLEVYLTFVKSDQYQEESGPPSPDNTRIVVKIHRGSSPEAFELLYRNTAWVRNNDASLEIDACFPEKQN
ncbi:MAG TPA: hypothetical protein VFG91_01450, partial [Woeseiaceae bacterium]|nr:hypothetical protein [Woeseiaceae bacterium]